MYRITGISLLDTDSTDGHGLDLYCLNNGIIVQTMLPFHKCSRIYEIKVSVIRGIRVQKVIKCTRKALCSSFYLYSE